MLCLTYVADQKVFKNQNPARGRKLAAPLQRTKRCIKI